MKKYFYVLTLLTITGTVVQSQMLDPSMDRENEPFCYFSKPTDVIGVMDGKEGTLIAPEGYLCTGFGELMFFVGDPPEPVNQRVKTLLRGYLPVVQYQFSKDDVEYRFEAFASTIDGNPESPLVNFVRVRISNRSKNQRAVFFRAATRYQNDANTDWGIGDNRFLRPAKAKSPGQYEQAGAEFNRNWEYSFTRDLFLRDGKVMYLFGTTPEPERRIVLKTGYNEPPESGSMKIPILPTTPVGVVLYTMILRSGGEQVLEFKMPYEPTAADDSLVGRMRSTQFDDCLAKTINFWEDVFARGIDISVPEEKVVNTYKANLVYDLIARNKHGDDYIQKVNEFQYDAFWLRDASYIVRMYDLSGYHDIARQCLAFFPRWQQPDGNFVSQGGQFDGWGQAMWAFGQHVRITRDTAFCRSMFPYVRRAFQWLRTARKGDSLHLIPATTPGDNENITGHVTGHNFWALAGLKNAIAMAEFLDEKSDLEEFRKEFSDFHHTLINRLHLITANTGGCVPPGLDSVVGYDWGNMLSVYPEQILGAHDPMVTATLNASRTKYQEGIMTYADGAYLHHYLTMKNTETEVIRGDQQLAIEELYALLIHTSATHAGFEFSILPWGTRDFGMNLSPHGWFAAKFRALLRNMMVREEGEQLHLLSCLSPEWVRDGSVISVKRAPTEFGVLSFEMRCRAGGAVLRLDGKLRREPERILLHLPWFMNVKTVAIDGKPASITGSTVLLPPESHNVEIQWTRNRNVVELSYDRSVKNYKQEYRRRYEQFLVAGKRGP